MSAPPINVAADDVPPGLLLPRRAKAIVMTGVILAMFTMALNQTIISVAMPRIVADLGGLDLFAWPFTSYLLASTAPVPFFGKLSDIYGRKPMLLIGLVVFSIGSMLAGVSGSMAQLIAFRAVQGLGGGLIMASAFSSIGDFFSPQDRGRWMGLFSGIFAFASVVGPLAGGVLTDNLSWRWVFYINLPFAILAFVIVTRGMPRYRPRHQQRVDYLGGILLIVATAPLLLAFSWGGNQYAWGDPRVLIAFLIAGLALAAFVKVEHGTPHAVLPLALFRNRAYLVSILALATVGMGMYALIQFMPLFVQAVQGSSATRSGTVTMPMMGGLVLGSAAAGQVLSQTSRARPLAIGGGLITALGTFLLASLSADASQWLIRGYMAVTGLGIGVTMPLYSVIVQNALPYSLLGVASASTQFFRQLGGSIGVAIFGSLMVTRFATHIGSSPDPSLAQLQERPQLLLDPDATAVFRDGIEARAPGTADAVIEAAQVALGSAITDLFFVSTFVMLVAILIAAFLPRIKMRTREEMVQTLQSDVGASSHSAGG